MAYYLNGTLLAKSTKNIAETIEMSLQSEFLITYMSRIEQSHYYFVSLDLMLPSVVLSKFRR